MTVKKLILPALLLARTITAQDCVYGTGEADPEALQCQPDLANSACCARGDICLSNGLCQAGAAKEGSYGASFFAVSCTDLDSSICKAVRTCQGVGGFGVKDCLNGNFCCGECDCNNSTALVSLGPYSLLTSLPLTPTSTPSSTLGIASATTVYATPTSDGTVIGGTSPTAGPTGSSSSSSENDSVSEGNGPQSSTTNKAAIGAGVGVGVFAVILAFLVGWWLAARHRKRKQQVPIPTGQVAELPMNPNLGGGYRDRVDTRHTAYEKQSGVNHIYEAPSEGGTGTSSSWRPPPSEMPTERYD